MNAAKKEQQYSPFVISQNCSSIYKIVEYWTHYWR